MKKRILCILLSVCMLLCYAPTVAFADTVELMDALANAEELLLPASFDYELGRAENSVLYNINGGSFYAVMGKTEFNKGDNVLISFNGKDESVDTSLYIFKDGETGIEEVKYVDNDNVYDNGEIFMFSVEETGIYYIVLAGYDDDDVGMCHAEISLESPEDINNVIEAAEEITLPAQFDYDLGSDNIINDSDNYYTGYYYAKAVKTTLEANDIINIQFASKTESVDTEVYIYYQNPVDLSFTNVFSNDNDLLNKKGENAYFSAINTGTYYIVLRGRCALDTGLCHVEISIKTGKRGTLDFTQETVPVPGEGDLWSWDADTKTLTLKDGFEIIGIDDDAITLPDGATVYAEGKAEILSVSHSCIYAIGSVCIKGNGTQNSFIECFAADGDYEGIYVNGGICIENCSLQIAAGDDGIYAKKGISVENCDLQINANSEGLYACSGEIKITDSVVNIISERESIFCDNDDYLYPSSAPSEDPIVPSPSPSEDLVIQSQPDAVTISDVNAPIYGDESSDGDAAVAYKIIIKNSTLVLVSGDEAIQNYYGDVEITDCIIDIDTTSDEEGIHSVDSNIIINGARLIIKAKENALEANTVKLSDVVFDLHTFGSYDLIDIDDATGFSLPGTFRLYSKSGDMLYEGEWKDELLDEDNCLYVGETKVYHAVSVHVHTYDGTWTTEDDNHWHECTNKWCPDANKGIKDKAPHGAEDDGDCTTAVICECGYVITEASNGHEFGEWQPNGDNQEKRTCLHDGCKAFETRSAQPDTGDNSNIALLFALLISSLGIFSAVTAYKKRRYSVK